MSSPVESPAAAPVAFGPFLLDAAQARLLREGQPVALSGRPFELLVLLVSRAGQLVSKDELLDGVWGHRHVTESVLKVALNALRTALGDDAKDPRYVATVPRRGLRFIAELRPFDTAPAPQASAQASDSLWGREADLAALRAALRSQRLVTLTGPAGVGKTALALAVAFDDAPRQGARVLRLDGLVDASGLLPMLAEALQLGAAAAQGPATMGRALQPLALRVVLDNAEHLVVALAPLLAMWLDAAPAVQWLVTSQLPLRLPAEQLLALAPLALPAEGDDVLATAAGRLFVERVRRLDARFEPMPADRDAIAAICRELDGLPLALEFAAARVPLLGVAGVRERLHERFTLLTHGPRGASPRHRTLAAALDWTVSLLPEPSRVALQRLSVLAGSFTVEAAEALLGAGAIDVLQTLREHSLLVSEQGLSGLPRLRLYDSVRRHALEALAASGGRQPAESALLRWLRQRFEAAELAEFEQPMMRWLPAQREDIELLRSALAAGLADDAGGADAAQQRDDAQRLVAASAPLAYRSGHRLEGWAWIERARSLPATPQTRVRLDHAFGLFVTFAQIGPTAEALAALQASGEVLLEQGDARRAYLSLYAQHMLSLRAGQPPQLLAGLLERLQRLEQPAWGPLPRRYRQLLLVADARNRGDSDEALRLARATAAACRTLGGVAEAWPFDHLAAQVIAAQGRWGEASEQLAAVLMEVHAAGALREQLPLVAMAASVHLRDGQAPDALQLAKRAWQLLQTEQMGWWMADALPWAALHEGRRDDALTLQAWADALVHQRGDRRGPVFARMREEFLNASGQEAAALAVAIDDEQAGALAFGRA